jgi:hypothetical protein
MLVCEGVMTKYCTMIKQLLGTDSHWNAVKYVFKNFKFIYLKLIFFNIFESFWCTNIKNNYIYIYYFNIFLSKNHFKKQYFIDFCGRKILDYFPHTRCILIIKK